MPSTESPYSVMLFSTGTALFTGVDPTSQVECLNFNYLGRSLWKSCTNDCYLQNYKPRNIIIWWRHNITVFCFSLQSSTQDCYANLTLKPPRQQSGRSSPRIQYSDVVHLEQPSDSEKEDEGKPDFVSNVSDLYASVQNQRTKTVNPADSGEDYANHLWEAINAICAGWPSTRHVHT